MVRAVKAVDVIRGRDRADFAEVARDRPSRASDSYGASDTLEVFRLVSLSCALCAQDIESPAMGVRIEGFALEKPMTANRGLEQSERQLLETLPVPLGLIGVEYQPFDISERISSLGVQLFHF